MADLYKKMPQDFLEDPIEVIKRNIYISPFWEEDLAALAELIGEEHVLFGSDYPHPEGLADPVSYVNELAGPTEDTVRKIMGGNLAKLMNVADTVASMTRPGGGWASIPAMTAAAAETFGERPAIVDGDLASPTPSWTRRPGPSPPRWWPPGSSPATGSRSGPSTASSGSSPCSGSSGPAPCWCRSTPASRGPRPPTSSPGAGRGSW